MLKRIPFDKDLTTEHQYKEYSADRWLKQNGLDSKTFVEDELYVSQALMIAKNLLKHHGKLLDHKQAQSLNSFISSKSKKVT